MAVLVGTTTAILFDGGRWHPISTWKGFHTIGSPPLPSAVVVLGRTVAMAFDHGEWGGGLVELQIDTEKTTTVPSDSEPCTCIDRGAAAVWAPG